ncbi:hypothetical protein [Paraburkholderia acidisoli]|uniref:Uncharacterized protein n=1 Tax=Paraburkholderia acidisoli TaxID=2571748 RepID=A0A7Z2GQE8_9BURK|nr:hypothetical protein [Paraburkholderia acidisoli]QGZ65891.1 hypothetical protein FAZ98_29085 [Paraburkholderia acidisoli]
MNKFKNLTYFSVRLLILLLILKRSGERFRPPPHQAPTLIGCKFLKIDSLKPLASRKLLRYCPAFSALLRQQQRNEIMKNLFRLVNIFFRSPFKTGTSSAKIC